MDITIKVETREGKGYSTTFIGNKDEILASMQNYIKDNSNHHISIFFSSEEESQHFTYDELFNPQ